MSNRILTCVVAFLLGIGLADGRAEEVVASHAGMTAVVTGDEACADVLRIMVEAPDAALFGGDKTELSVLMEAIRTRLKFDCPEAEDVLVEGMVDGVPVYRGAFSKGTGWTLVDLAPPKVPRDTKSAQAEQTGNAEPSKDKTKLMSLTLASCETKYRKPDFCICAMEQLTKIDLSLAEWELISQDFLSVVELSKKVQGIRSSLRACYG